MEPIRSRTTTERIVRATLLMVLINGFAVAFLWDGYVGYARRNAAELVGSLGLADEASREINPALTSAEAGRLMQDVESGADAAGVAAVLGPPAIEHGDDTYYLGPGGHLRIRWDQGRVARVLWTDGVHTERDLAIQRWFGYVLAVLGVIYIIHFIRVVTTRVSLTDAGLRLGGALRIPFDAMTALRPDRSGRSGRAELEYTLDGQKGAVRLDSYVVKELPAIVTAICEQKGFTNPFQSDACNDNVA